MPELAAVDGASINTLCVRCDTSIATFIIRSERLCKDCFFKYVGSKLLKRLEANKIRGGYHEAQKTLLLPVSFDVSSICLLHALDQQLQKRLQSGRHAGYTLHILCIDESSIREDSSVQTLLPLLKQRFPNYMYSAISLADVFTYDIDLKSLTPERPGAAVCEEGREIQNLQSLILDLPSSTSKGDVVQILRRRLCAAFAKRNGSSSILYSDSTTKLAERTLSETAKGRGGALPWLTSDNYTVDGIPCSYPLRDLLQKELVLYTDITCPSLKPLITPADNRIGIVSSKDMTIDGLMSQYFESLEENFPSIVANVVRTSSKLAARLNPGCEQTCDLCKLPINHVEWGGEQSSPDCVDCLRLNETRTQWNHCPGCTRTLQRR